MVKIWKVIGIVMSVLVIGALGFCGIWTVRNWNTVYSSFDGTSFYTYEDMQKLKQDTIEECAKNEASYKEQINNLREQIVNLQDENKVLQNENQMYKDFVDNYGKEGISVLTFEIDGVLFDIIPVDNGVTLSNVLTPLEVPEKEGYNFIGWSIDGQNIVDPTVYKVTENVILKAVYEIKVYTVKFVRGLSDSEQNIIFYETTITHGQKISNDILNAVNTSALQYVKAEPGMNNVKSVSWGIEGYTGTIEYDENGNALFERVAVTFEEYSILKNSMFYIVSYSMGSMNDLPEVGIGLGNY